MPYLREPMLESLSLTNVGPAPKMEVELAPRLNLITGDNGLGKSFLLDVAWWALTRKWPRDLNPRLTSGYPARPSKVREPASIGFRLKSKSQVIEYESRYVPRDEAWLGKPGRPWNPGLVIYALADGGFSVWDPARNYWKKKGNLDVQERLPGYVFSATDVWDGLEIEVDGRPILVSNGLIRDWSAWIKEDGHMAHLMSQVIRELSPTPSLLEVGPLVRLSLDDARDIPSIKTPYADAVPILHASSGIRRIVGLAYMLLWAWTEHARAAEQLGEGLTNQVLILFDEIEAHLHPQWQRRIVPSLLRVMDDLTWQVELRGDKLKAFSPKLQLIAATHSPLVLASVEPIFDEQTDRIIHLEQRGSSVDLRELPWAKQGDVLNWLVSESFGLRQARSVEAEVAVEAAEAWMRGERGPLLGALDTTAAIHTELLRVLPGHDPFWPRWIVQLEGLTGQAP